MSSDVELNFSKEDVFYHLYDKIPESKEVYLPEVSNSESDPYTTLRHLTHLPEGKIPFTVQQVEKFRKSSSSLQKTDGYLGWKGFAILGSLQIAATFSTLPLKNIFHAQTDEHKQFELELGFGLLSIIASLGVCFLAMKFTGTNPNNASNAANMEQDEIHYLKDHFHFAARKLIRLYWSNKQEKQKEAEKIAQSIDIELLKKYLRNYSTGGEMVVEELSSTLEAAIHYIKSGEKPFNPDIRDYVTNKVVLRSAKENKALKAISLEHSKAWTPVSKKIKEVEN